MLQPKPVPMRECVVTKEQHPKKEMIRIVKNKENNVFIDLKGKQNGRGAYIILRKDVIDKAKKSGVLDKKLETEIPMSLYDELYALLDKEKKNG